MASDLNSLFVFAVVESSFFGRDCLSIGLLVGEWGNEAEREQVGLARHWVGWRAGNHSCTTDRRTEIQFSTIVPREERWLSAWTGSLGPCFKYARW